MNQGKVVLSIAFRCVRGCVKVYCRRRGDVGYRGHRTKIENNLRKEVWSAKIVCLKDEVVGLMYMCCSSLATLSRTIRERGDGDCGVEYKKEVWLKEQ